jgi:D-tagatose-1,6-bisphosphate aldolase subunit GatZ/KbaZ
MLSTRSFSVSPATPSAGGIPPHPLDNVVRAQKAGLPIGITSICSAHPLVLEAAMRQALANGSAVLIEATSNQVDQTGGYTGMWPTDFRDMVYSMASRLGLESDRVILGGDHLGPNRWRALPAETAMQNSEVLVAAYVEAGFTKIHLDCSYSCADDTEPLTDELMAARAARMLRVAEQTATAMGRPDSLRYVIGTEVPTPGGAHATIDGLQPTSLPAAKATLAAHRAAFADVGLAAVWSRVIALVVQPGVEFDHQQVFMYEPRVTVELQQALDDEPTMVFEAHSTDYQTAAKLSALVEDHWAVLKVGPGLTYALREAMFALATIEDTLVDPDQRSNLRDVIEQRMLTEPDHWSGYYLGDKASQAFARTYSYSDRMRYYWAQPDVHKAQEHLLDNLSDIEIPLPLLSQYLPIQYMRIQNDVLASDPRAIVVDRVRDVLRQYATAGRQIAPDAAAPLLPL